MAPTWYPQPFAELEAAPRVDPVGVFAGLVQRALGGSAAALGVAQDSGVPRLPRIRPLSFATPPPRGLRRRPPPRRLAFKATLDNAQEPINKAMDFVYDNIIDPTGPPSC